ncbi:endonuclease III domain-containing protein [Pelovirga terrestris]|uniref:Endonuclease III domain-containing protein n=1 Tax=Pelovirga terrestris TaxID=2771352 RepID=A0A8J6UP55_9BACT|nr:endonuclease III domain-containing protein [Pelovirga terrestris]MBD1400409.1 endonuclease III domain-containing protein [Pelovirga terrestris]
MPTILEIYRHLGQEYCLDSWWPAQSPFEVAVGAFLTQNTNWHNVEKALANLREAEALDLALLADMPLAQLEQLIRPSGFFRQKAQRLQHFCRYVLDQHGGSLEDLLQRDLEQTRNELLTLSGIGPETADSILLYAGQRPSFVVDSYTRRFFGRLGLLTGTENYDDIRTLFMAEVNREVPLYQHYHALIVTHCKERCRKSPLCSACFFKDICDYATQAA